MLKLGVKHSKLLRLCIIEGRRLFVLVFLVGFFICRMISSVATAINSSCHFLAVSPCVLRVSRWLGRGTPPQTLLQSSSQAQLRMNLSYPWISRRIPSTEPPISAFSLQQLPSRLSMMQIQSIGLSTSSNCLPIFAWMSMFLNISFALDSNAL